MVDNIKIQTNVITLSHKYKVKKLIFIGSSCIYPKFSKNPIKEASLLEGALEETNQWYAITKIHGIKFCEAFKNNLILILYLSCQQIYMEQMINFMMIKFLMSYLR